MSICFAIYSQLSMSCRWQAVGPGVLPNTCAVKP